MRTLYHEFESLEHLLATRLLPGGDDQPIRLVVFGGTGAVGGAAVMELCRLILQTQRRPLRGEIWATGLGDKEISKFVSRLYMAVEDEVEIEKLEPLRHYRINGVIDLRFSILRLQIPSDLAEQVAERSQANPELSLPRLLGDFFAEQPCPFLSFVDEIKDPLHAAVVAIPLPSVATYTLTSIDAIVKSHGLDHATGQRVKKHYLNTFIRGLAEIHQRHARRVVMAHTTAVGGMYRVDAESAEIRLGFAHSALGKKLVDKKYFADELTQLFVDHGFDVMVTAAAIGIDAVDSNCPLPSNRAVMARMRSRQEASEHELVSPADLEERKILLYPNRRIRFEPVAADDNDGDGQLPESVAPAQQAPAKIQDVEAQDVEAQDVEAQNPALEVTRAEQNQLTFGRGKDLRVEAAIRSGENGLFSVANCVALYNVMKVAIPEELAMVLVRHALFGPERRRDWFHERICYYTETENCYFALRLLDSYPELVRAHHGAFAIQSFQALGSATHQARLHELGLVMLILRLRQLRESFLSIPDEELLGALSDLDTFMWRHTSIPAFQDLDGLDAETLATDLACLCETNTLEDVGQLVGYDPRAHAVRPPGREKFLHRLATRIQRYLHTITSLGIPILYRSKDGVDRLLVGPYVAPFDTAVSDTRDLQALWSQLAEKHGVEPEDFRDWAVVNNGFVDLRPVALASSAQEPGLELAEHLGRFDSAEQLTDWLGRLETGSYFTTCGLIATLHRLGRLGSKVRQRKVQLGTRETWKHLFRQDRDGRHLISPGLVETVRMYSEGQGKVTGTEALWPRWGY